MPKNDLNFDPDFEHPTFQGVNSLEIDYPGCRFACLGYALLAFQAVSVQIRNLSYFTTKAHAILCAKDW